MTTTLSPAIKAYIEANFQISNLNDCLVILPKEISDINELLHYLPDYTIAHISKEPATGDLTLNIHKEPPVIHNTNNKGLAMLTHRHHENEKELKTLINTYIDRLKQVVTTVDSKRKISWTQRHFISNLSHQVKTPLNSIISGVQLIEHYVKDEFVSRILEYMLQSSVELTTYINDIVDFYYMKKNDIDLQLEPVSIAKTLEYTTDLFRQQLIDSQIALDVIMDPELPETVLLDDKRFTQVIMNLFSNAVKYTEYAAGNNSQSQGILITVDRLSSTLASLTIQDTGTGGIDVHDQDKYFEPFNQIESGESATSEDGVNSQPIWLDAPDGLGLGLCISRYLVSKMGGTLRFVDPPDAQEGFVTAIQLTFPLDICGKQQPQQTVPNKPVLVKVKPAAKSIGRVGSSHAQDIKRIDFVLVDDNIANLELLELILRDKLALDCYVDYNIATFTDPCVARDHIIENSSPNMIVLADIKMPRLNGFALITQVLDKLDPVNIPHFVYITALSALDVTGRVNDILAKYTGCKVDVIYKPINIKTLETTLKTIINEIDYPDSVIECSKSVSSPKCERSVRPTIPLVRASTTV